MLPNEKIDWLAVLISILAGLCAVFFLLALSGCAAPAPPPPPGASISQAAEISDRIDGKTVVITEWLQTH